VEVLLAHGAEVNAQTSGGDTPLHIATGEDMVELLRQHGGHE
jgi:ankyrin repeat protein